MADSPTGIERIAAGLRRPSAHPEPTERVEEVETHISKVFLGDHHVVKVKKALAFPFLDYSTPDLRLEACRDEVRLNRRLAPDVYLGFAPIRSDEGGLAAVGAVVADPDAEVSVADLDGVLDWCVVMRRLPEAKMLHRRIDEGGPTDAEIAGMLDRLVAFYTEARRGPDVDAFGRPDAIEANVRENFATLAPREHGLPAELFDRVRASQCGFLALQRGFFETRLREGRIREGHGDLRPDHVCFLDPPVVFDCVEFSLGFRSSDVLSEIAFLAMECDFFGARHLAAKLFEGYRERSGDDAGWPAFRFYEAYRACVRAKVEALRSDQTEGEKRTTCLDRARRYLSLASYYALEFYRPRVVVVMGASGTGKSTVATALAERLGCEVISTDVTRRELLGASGSDAGYGDGLYTPDRVAAVYDEMRRQARARLAESVSVVLDGTFRNPAERDRVRDLAHEMGADHDFLCLECSPEVARVRIEERRRKGVSLSEARPEHHEKQVRELEAALAGDRDDVAKVPADGTPEATVDSALAAMRPSAES